MVFRDAEDDRQRPSSWGYACKMDTTGVLEEKFKTDFGLVARNKSEWTEQKKAELLYQHFLTCIYEHLRTHFNAGHLGGRNWDDLRIQFSFSIPATWKVEGGKIQAFRKLAKDAGFGRQKLHDVQVSLTEPHAVAAYTMVNEGFVQVSYFPSHISDSRL